MRIAGILFATLLLPLAASAGCDTKVKQKQPPRIPDDSETGDDSASITDSDMAAVEPKTVEVDETEEKTPEEQKLACCQECVAGVEADTSGDPPGALNCQMLTDHVSARCINWMATNPMTGQEAKDCVGGDAPAGDGDAG